MRRDAQSPSPQPQQTAFVGLEGRLEVAVHFHSRWLHGDQVMSFVCEKG